MAEQNSGGTVPTPSRPSDVTLYVELAPELSTSLDYDAGKATARASCAVSGTVWNTDYAEDRFEGAQVRISFIKGIDGRMDKYARDHVLPGACGVVEIARELMPDSYETEEGETITLPQITIWVGVDGESFRSIEAALTSCVGGDRQARMSVSFSHRTFTEAFMRLSGLNLSEKMNYPVVRFNVSCFKPASER